MGSIVVLPHARREPLHIVRTYGTAVMLLTEAASDTVSPRRLSVVGPAPVGVKDLAVLPNSHAGRTGANSLASTGGARCGPVRRRIACRHSHCEGSAVLRNCVPPRGGRPTALALAARPLDGRRQ